MTVKKTLTGANGAPIANDDNSFTAGERGSLTFDSHYLFEKLAHFNRERIPERVVHARGYGAYGTFTLTKDLSQYTVAEFLQTPGTKTPVFTRFSTVAGGQDSGDYVRDVRGFAVKFYTHQGVWDMVGNNTPVFFIRDPLKFPDFIHSQKKDPCTNLPNPANHWEFWAQHPQSLHQVTILMSDRGIPASLRHMHGFSSHTLSLWNNKKELFWVKWHFKTDQGIKNLTNEQAEQKPLDGAQRDLVESIAKGDYPSWTVKLQIMSQEQAKNFHVNPFDLTKVWPQKLFPLEEIGKFELNRNVDNYFAETEQSAFNPGNLVPGIGVSPDKVLQARLFAYADAQRYRVGVNHQQLQVNAPRCPVSHYQRDGAMAGLNEQYQQGSVNFYPNERLGSPEPDESLVPPPIPIEEAYIKAYDSQDEDNYSQAGDLFRLMSSEQKLSLTTNIAEGLKLAKQSVQDKMLEHFAKADKSYAKMVKKALNG